MAFLSLVTQLNHPLSVGLFGPGMQFLLTVDCWFPIGFPPSLFWPIPAKYLPSLFNILHFAPTTAPSVPRILGHPLFPPDAGLCSCCSCPPYSHTRIDRMCLLYVCVYNVVQRREGATGRQEHRESKFERGSTGKELWG